MIAHTKSTLEIKVYELMRLFHRAVISIYLRIHEKWSPWNCLTKLCDNRIFKGLLQIKKSLKFNDFDLDMFSI